jgi:hypothetical protein
MCEAYAQKEGDMKNIVTKILIDVKWKVNSGFASITLTDIKKSYHHY